MKTTLAKKGTIDQRWYHIDASGKVLGRLAVQVATIIRGRHKPTYTPSVDTGDFVIVTNIEKVVVSGKKETQKKYMSYSGYFGNEKYRSVEHYRSHRPEFLLMHAVKGMLPKNSLADHMLTKLKVYAGAEHPHQAQEPVALES
ncbi:MAG: 50S ribosomal protein L13 [Verrucomicrobia bacterium 21-51-4]|nr:MAG: 50S ribosomal protein L13 [Verrucomicrobia bacterium 21-51-4]HQU09108.1 50S ribosomal protein L13 [Opitutales bacterium]